MTVSLEAPLVSNDEDDQDDGEVGVRVVHHHYTQSKNGRGDGININTVLLACLIGVVAFVGAQVWSMNGRMAAFEATLTLLVQRSGITNPQQ